MSTQTDPWIRTDQDLLEESPSCGWKELCAILEVSPETEPDTDAIAAATRENHPKRYRQKHALGVSS